MSQPSPADHISARLAGLPPEMAREIASGLAILRRAGVPAAVIFRLSRDRHGVERLTAERMEGVPLAALTDGVGSET